MRKRANRLIGRRADEGEEELSVLVLEVAMPFLIGTPHEENEGGEKN